MMLRIGFTGTQMGMTAIQKLVVRDLLLEEIRQFYVADPENVDKRIWVSHGDCTGADAEFDEIAYELGFWRQIFPSDIEPKRAHCDVSRPHRQLAAVPKLPLERNGDIVRFSTSMIATPKTIDEHRRSGTWATVRLAKRLGRQVTIVRPDGVRMTR